MWRTNWSLLYLQYCDYYESLLVGMGLDAVLDLAFGYRICLRIGCITTIDEFIVLFMVVSEQYNIIMDVSKTPVSY